MIYNVQPSQWCHVKNQFKRMKPFHLFEQLENSLKHEEVYMFK